MSLQQVHYTAHYTGTGDFVLGLVTTTATTIDRPNDRPNQQQLNFNSFVTARQYELGRGETKRVQ